MFRKYIILLLLILVSAANIQARDILIKLTIKNARVRTTADSYIVINADSLLKCNDEYYQTGDFDVLYNITKCGGYNILNRAIAFDIKGCCEMGDVQTFSNAWYRDTAKYGNFEKYRNAEALDFSKLKKHSRGFTIPNNTWYATCHISVWDVDMECCLCNSYETTCGAVYDRKKLCHVKRFGGVSKMKKGQFQLIRNKLTEMISHEKWE